MGARILLPSLCHWYSQRCMINTWCYSQPTQLWAGGGYHFMLLIGVPASSKTLFLMGILDIRKDAVYFDGSNTTNRILDVLKEKRPKIILLNEIDKMSRQFQNQLLGFMRSGRVDVEQQRRQYHFKIE